MPSAIGCDAPLGLGIFRIYSLFGREGKSIGPVRIEKRGGDEIPSLISSRPENLNNFPSAFPALSLLDLRPNNDDEEQLKEAQSNVVEMAHTALGHLEALKKKELLLAALLMTQEEFDK